MISESHTCAHQRYLYNSSPGIFQRVGAIEEHRKMRNYLRRIERDGVQRVKMFLVITAAYVIFWGPLFFVTLVHHPAIGNTTGYEVRWCILFSIQKKRTCEFLHEFNPQIVSASREKPSNPISPVKVFESLLEDRVDTILLTLIRSLLSLCILCRWNFPREQRRYTHKKFYKLSTPNKILVGSCKLHIREREDSSACSIYKV